MMRHRPWFIKLVHWEYWPMWVFYIPVWLQHFWLALRVRNLFFFLGTNPAVEGFILSDSKFRTLQLVPEEHRPKAVYIPNGMRKEQVFLEMEREGIRFPVILKPDIGFRGLKVCKVETAKELDAALKAMKVPALLQAYCDQPLEVGIFYYRYPDNPKGCIPSITIKEFLKVEGDGIHSLGTLVQKNPRAVLQLQKIRKRFRKQWDRILPEKEVITLEPMGNHNRGTRFIDGTYLVDETLLEVFDALNRQMEGFYFGRFDIKCASWEALKKHRAYSILEVNGVGGEPTHIYDSERSLRLAWKDLCSSWKVAARIAEINFANGVERPTYIRARNLWRTYVAYKASLFAETTG